MNVRKSQKYIFLFFLVLLHLIFFVACFLASRETTDKITAPLSTVFILILTAPIVYFFSKWLGRNRLYILLVLSVFGLTIESIALATGFPYGNFVYNNQSGYQIFYSVPITTPFAWLIILLGCFVLANGFFSSSQWKRNLLSIVLMVWVDLLLDPVAVSLKWWFWPTGGSYFGVPLVNFLGWIISSFFGITIFWYLVRKVKFEKASPVEISASLYFLLIFLLSIAFWKSLYLPLLLGIMFILFNYRTWRRLINNFLYV